MKGNSLSKAYFFLKDPRQISRGGNLLKTIFHIHNNLWNQLQTKLLYNFNVFVLVKTFAMGGADFGGTCYKCHKFTCCLHSRRLLLKYEGIHIHKYMYTHKCKHQYMFSDTNIYIYIYIYLHIIYTSMYIYIFIYWYTVKIYISVPISQPPDGLISQEGHGVEVFMYKFTYISICWVLPKMPKHCKSGQCCLL